MTAPPYRDVNTTVSSVISNIVQVDGVNSINSSSSSEDELSDTDNSNVTNYDSQDEIDPDTTPIIIPASSKPSLKQRKILKASSLPLAAVLNCRSLYNKPDNFKKFMNELGIEVAIISESWEREELSLENLLQMPNYKVHSYRRPKTKAKKQPGGACAIIYKETRFKANKLNVYVPNGVEACWIILKPINQSNMIENIVVGSVYVSPTSKFKTASINHIIDTIHLLRAQFDNRVNYLIGGDLNRLKIDRILESYTPLRQIITSATRQSAILENVITDLHTMYQTPQCLPPLQVDEDKAGSDSDHNIAVLPPITLNNSSKPVKRSVVTRPLPQSGVEQFGQFICGHGWEEVLGEQNLDKKVENFHKTLRTNLDMFFPEKSVMVSCLDRKWMTPQLKNLNRRTKREFYKNRKSPKWKRLKKKFKKLKRSTVKNFYSNFVTELKESNPAKWYSMAKRLGAEQNNKTGELSVDCLKGLSNQQAAEQVAEHFSRISQEYSPLDMEKLPAYLPAPEILQVEEADVAERLYKLKCRKSTQPIDLPSTLRKQFPCELATPLTDIINTCLSQHKYPSLWKHEWVIPAEKISNPVLLKHLRKISLTSEFSLVFEGILKDWIMEDIAPKIDKGQFGNQKGTGTEHLMVKLMDKLLDLLDKNNNRSAVIASLIDWASAFDRQDATLAIQKFIQMGVRPAVVPVLASYLTERQMQVKFNDTYSGTHKLPGGGPQGTLVGLIEYFVQSNDNADCVEEDLRFKFVDDLSVLELVMLNGLLTEYNFKQHVASDIGIDEMYVPPTSLNTQETLNKIADWTDVNKMQLNKEKTNYMIFSRSETEFATRLTLEGNTLDRVEETKLVGVWLTTWLDWDKNTRETCKKAYARLTMLTKLKYVGVPKEDLIHIYILYVRSLLEYCSTVWHSTLTVEQSNNLERVQKLCLKIILGEDYHGYDDALEKCGLERLTLRREAKCLNFGLKSLLHPIHSEMFPVNPQVLTNPDSRIGEHFVVNHAKRDSYRDSAVPYIQRMLNEYVKQQKKTR